MKNIKDIRRSAEALAKSGGLVNMTRQSLCAHAGVSPSLFSKIVGCSFLEYVETLIAEGLDAGDSTINRARANPALRKNNMLDVALVLAEEVGYTNVTRAALAKAAGVSEGLVSKHFGTMPQLKRDLMRAAVSRGVMPVIAQGLSHGDKHAQKAPAEVKESAAQYMARV